jgi:methylmalonyl-CoA mutase N-terminal domain/subunit
MGGAVAATEAGFVQDEIARSAYDYQRNIERGEKIIVGVNKFTVEHEQPIPVFRIDDSIREVQSAKLAALRAGRDAAKAAQCLNVIEAAANDGTNLMPGVIDAVENKCTLGEIADVLRKVYGEYK